MSRGRPPKSLYISVHGVHIKVERDQDVLYIESTNNKGIGVSLKDLLIEIFPDEQGKTQLEFAIPSHTIGHIVCYKTHAGSGCMDITGLSWTRSMTLIANHETRIQLDAKRCRNVKHWTVQARRGSKVVIKNALQAEMKITAVGHAGIYLLNSHLRVKAVKCGQYSLCKNRQSTVCYDV